MWGWLIATYIIWSIIYTFRRISYLAWKDSRNDPGFYYTIPVPFCLLSPVVAPCLLIHSLWMTFVQPLFAKFAIEPKRLLHSKPLYEKMQARRERLDRERAEYYQMFEKGDGGYEY